MISNKGSVMTKNIGMIDRVLRIVIGIILIAFALKIGFGNTGWNWIGWIGVIPIVTALVGSCPLYSLVGVNTCAR